MQRLVSQCIRRAVLWISSDDLAEDRVCDVWRLHRQPGRDGEWKRDMPKEAERAGLRGTYKTWLSTASGSDNSGPSFTQGPRPTFPSGYILIDGPTVSSLAALTTPTLNSGGGFDAQDGLAPSQPATGDPSGAIIKATAATATESACNGWTISTSAPNGTGGAYTGAAPSAPDALQEHEIVECGPAHYLYCIQQ